MSSIERRRFLRRRLAAVAVIALGVALATGELGGGDGPLHGLPTKGPDARRAGIIPGPTRLTVEASGDLLIHSSVWERAQALAHGQGYDFAPMFGEIRPYVAGADLALCHIETPMTPAPPTSYPIFNTPPELAKAVAETGWDACDTASNHSLDQGQTGVVDTGKALDAAGVEHTGSFASAAAQRRPLILSVQGAKIALLAYTTDNNGDLVPEPYSVNDADPTAILAAAHRAVRAGADAVIVNLHWGGQIVPEYQAQPSAAQMALVRRLTASPDITAIVGQGPHCVQPIERINGKVVVFSEGNLVSNQSPAAGLPAVTQDGLVALLHLTIGAHSSRVAGVRYVPVWVRHPDFEVLPVGAALEGAEAPAASLRASYARTVGVAGRGNGIQPVPGRLPG